jgi:hypothetical protein
MLKLASIVLAFAIAVVLAMPAKAELTQQEAAEVLKVVTAARKVEAGVVKLAKFIKSNPAGGDFINKPILFGSINPALNAMFHVRTSLTHLLWVYENIPFERASRAENLAEAWPQLDHAIRQFRQSAQRAKTVPQFVAAAADFEAAANILASIDRSLPYGGDNPFPPSYPRIVGPHGDYDTAQANIALSTKYLEHFMSRTANKLGAVTYPNTARANRSMASVYENIAHAFASWIRVMAMKGGVVLPEDMAIAVADQTASSGLRPVSFFLALRQVELVLGRTQFTVFSERRVAPGIAFFYREMVMEWGRVLGEFAVTDPAYVEYELKAGGSSIFALPVSWAALDMWAVRHLLFFHELPGPPVRGG